MMRNFITFFLSLCGAATAHKEGFKENIKVLSSTHKQNAARRDIVFSHAKGLDSSGGRTRDRRNIAELPVLKIPVKFHVVHNGKTGRVPLKNVQMQIDVLNDAFRGRTTDTSPNMVKEQFQTYYGAKNVAVDAKIEFILSGAINYVDNKRWYKCGESDTIYDEIKMGTTVEPEKYLNMFTCNGGQILGSSMFPDESMKPSDKRWAMMLSDFTLPGFTADMQGDTATHELGHFFGLYHTFYEGGGKKCKNSGDDGVADTPFEDEATYGCPVENSCTKEAAADPVWNFMDYTDDSCMWRFTSGQVTKMHRQLELYKPTLYKASLAIGEAPNPTTKGRPPSTAATAAPPPPPATPAPPPAVVVAGSSGSGSSGTSGSGSFSDPGSSGSSGADIVKMFAGKWGWTDWHAILADENWDGSGSGGSALYQWSGSGSWLDFDEALPGSCSAEDCGLRDFDRTCSCEASCEFFRDCCADYKSVCDAVKSQRRTKVVELKAAKAEEEADATDNNAGNSSAAPISESLAATCMLLFASVVFV
eukprot:gene3688-3345_t